jgi:hypothetical protein
MSFFRDSSVRVHFQLVVPIRIRDAPLSHDFWRNAGATRSRTPRDQVSGDSKTDKEKENKIKIKIIWAAKKDFVSEPLCH